MEIHDHFWLTDYRLVLALKTTPLFEVAFGIDD